MSITRVESQPNVSGDERFVSKLFGSVLLLFGLEQRSFSGLMLGAMGTALLYRGATGNCQLYRALNIDTAERDASQSLEYFETQEEAPDLT